jgi:hypothetical protein
MSVCESSSRQEGDGGEEEGRLRGRLRIRPGRPCHELRCESSCCGVDADFEVVIVLPASGLVRFGVLGLSVGAF